MKYEDLIKLSHDYDVPLVDVIFISINRYGVEMDTTEKRIRLKIKLDIAKEEYYLAIPVNTYPSPFKIIDNKTIEIHFSDQFEGETYQKWTKTYKYENTKWTKTDCKGDCK